MPAAAKTIKIAPLCSARPVLPKTLPPSVLAVPRDLRVLQYPKSQTTRKSRRTASTDGGSLLGNMGLALQRGAIFEVLFVVFYGNHESREAQARFGLRNGRWLGEPLRRGSCITCHVPCL